MGYTGGKGEIIWFLLVMLSFCVVAVNTQSNSEYGGWPDLTRRVPQKVDPPGCSYKAQKYQHGEQVETPEPCLNCTCIRAVLVCYLRVCPTAVAPPPGCFPAREPGHCCPTIVCGINDLIPQINGDKGSDSKNKTEAEDDDEEPELRPVFRPSTTTSEEDLITDEDIVKKNTGDSIDVGPHSMESDKTTDEKSVSSTYTTVPKFQSTTDGEWTTDDISKMQQGISSSSGPTIRFSVEPSSTELDESISKIPSTTWFSVPDVIVKETTVMEETPTSLESFDIDKFTTGIRESTGNERIISSTRTTSFDNVFVTEGTKAPDSLLFITSTTTSPHSDFGEYDFNFLNDIPGGCLVNGTLYGDGSAMLSSSFCEYCFCIRGKRTCLKPKCHLAIEGCAAKYDSEYTCCPSRYDCSERSTTSEATSWEIPSSEAPTTLHENLDGFCLVDNKIYALGNVIPDYQTCHNCYCNDSNIVCNKISCSPPVDGCDPIIPEGHCCPISYRCDSPQTDPDEIETNNDIPAPNKLEVDTRATTTEKTVSTSLKQTIKSPSYQGSKINYSHKTKGHPKPFVPSSINYGVKTGNRKTPQIHRLKQPLVHSGQKTGGIKNLNAIHRRIDDSNATIDENGDFDLIEIDNDYEGYLLDHPENIDISPESSLAVGNTYTESIARQSRHDTTIDEGVSKEYESDLTGSASSFVTKSLDENAPTISSRENDKTLNIDDLDLESLIVSTMEAISAMSEFIPPNTTIKPESSSKYDEVSETYFPSMSWNDRDTSTFSSENPEVHTISLEELFKKFVMKARENMSEPASDAPEIKTDTSETVRNNSKQPIYIDEIQLQSSITNITKHVDKTHETTISEILNNNISKPMKNNQAENVTHNISITTTAENLETDKEENKGITHKDLIINFETHPISSNPTSKVPEPVYTHSTPSSITNKDQGLSDSNTKLLEFQKDSKSDLYHIEEKFSAEKTLSTQNYDTTNIDVLTADTNAPVSDKSENKSTSINIDKDESHQRINETIENSSSNVSTTSVQPDFTRGAIWTLVSSSAPTLITSSTDPTFPKATHNDLVTENRLKDDTSTTVNTTTEFATTIPPILKPQTTSRKNSKLPIEILTVYEISKNAGNHSTPLHVFETTTDLGIKNTETTNKTRDIYSPETILGLTSTIPASTKSSDSEIKTSTTLSDFHDNAHDRDNDYDYFSDDSLDDIDFLSKSHNEGVLEFLSGFTKSVPHLTETKETQEQTTENMQETSTSQPEIISLQTTTTAPITTTTTITVAPENVGIVKIGAPISVLDNESIYNHSVISDNFESKSKVRTTESGGVIYMDPKYTDIKIEQPNHDEHEKVPMIPKATEVFELSSEASSQSSPSTDSLENRADTDLSQLEKKKEPRIQDPTSQSDTENRHPNSNYKVIPFVVADALKGSQNKSQSMLVVQDDTLTTQDVVSDFCFINGRIYINGEMVAKSDPCELCRCFYGRELCQLQRCPAPPAPDCVPEYLPGFCCPRLTCGKNGTPEKPGLEQLLAPPHRSPPVKSPVIHVSSANTHASHVKPTNSQVAQSLPVKPQVILGQRRPINSQANQQESTNQQRPSVVIQQQPPYRQGTPYRSPQQPDRFLIGVQNQKQANEVRPNVQLSLPVPPSNGNVKDEATPSSVASSVKFGLRVRPPSTTWSQEISKWTTASTRVTRSTTIQRMSSPPYTTTVSSTPPFRRQTTSTQTSSTQPTSTTTTASTTTSTTAKITQKPTTPTVVTLPTTAYEAAQNGFIDPWGLLKVSGCNIYGKFYNVNERVEVLSGPCSHCICAANGVECNDIC